jgi:hypothetical protein
VEIYQISEEAETSFFGIEVPTLKRSMFLVVSALELQFDAI